MTGKIAFRNVFRQKRRSILTALTMFGGFVLASISLGLGEGTYSTVIDGFTRSTTGHIQIHGRGYLDRPSLYNTLDDYERIGAIVEDVEGVESWAPRIYSGAIVSVGENTSGAQVTGIDPGREASTTTFARKITSGSMLQNDPAQGVLIGKGLAKILETGLSDRLVLVSQAADGSIANDAYTIAGIVDSGDVMSDRMTVYLHIEDAQELFVLHGRAHEIAIIGEDIGEVRDLSRTLESSIDNPELEVAPWQVFAETFYRSMQADKQGNYITQLIIMIIVAVGVLNTVLMSVLERTREYGLLKALGTKPVQIFFLIFLEVSILAAMSIICGAGTGIAANYILSHHGIPLPIEVDVGGYIFDTLRSDINAMSLVIPAVLVFIAAVTVSVIPAVRAARTVPVKAMRMH
jgi:ABC-type lipoprotein release transport system permease subunit